MAPSKCKQLCLSVGLFATGVLSQNFPSVDNFQRFSRAKATVLGDYIYIDGGEVSQKGRNSRGSDPMNATLSIDCSSSWSPDTVEIREISKPQSLPTLSNQNLFTDASRNSFYVWGGYVPFDESADSSNLWKFSVDGEGGGSWVREAPGNADFFVDLERTENGATTSSPGAGFVFGGKILDSSSKATGQNEKGTVTFDFGSKNWSQNSEGPFSPDQTLWGATATFVEGFADEGLIFLLGGMNRRDERAAGYLDFETVHFFDVAKRDWYEQKTTGDVPGVRFHHCAVAMTDSSSNETSEIFVYGGWNEDSKTPYSEVHTLTIPGFHWTKLNDDGENHVRAEHQCLNLGNNQLVTIGGLLFTGDVGDDWDLVDPYPRGIGIFDLNELAWKDQYDADAGDYRRHNDTAKWYDEGGLDNVEWSSDATKALLVSPSSSPGSDGGDNSNGGGGSGGNNDSNSGSGSGSSAGAIAGGVVGGVAGIALVGGLVWYLLRKRRAPTAELVAQPLQPSYVGQDLKSPPPSSASPYAVSELQDASHPHQYHAELDAAGMPGSRSELAPGPLFPAISRLAVAVLVLTAGLIVQIYFYKSFVFYQDSAVRGNMGAPGYRSVAYYVNWATYGRKHNPQDLPVENLTHVLYAFANVRADSGDVVLTDEWADTGIHFPPGDSWNDTGNNMYGCLKQLNLLKRRNRNLKALLSIGGWTYSANFKVPASTPQGRSTFARTGVELVKKYGFDGLDIDWEYPQNADEARNFVELLAEVRGALDAYSQQLASETGNAPYHFELTVACPAGSQNFSKMDIRGMDAYLDFWNLMAYDFAGSWDQLAGHQANVQPSGENPGSTPFSMTVAIDAYLNAGVRPDKLVIGMPLYGRAFENTDGPGKPFQGIGEGTWEQGVWDYKKLPPFDFLDYFDQPALASYCYNPNTRKMISYDSPQMVRIKSDIIRQRALGGVMWWESSADKEGKQSLIWTVVDDFGGPDALQKVDNLLDYPHSPYDNLRAGFPNN